MILKILMPIMFVHNVPKVTLETIAKGIIIILKTENLFNDNNHFIFSQKKLVVTLVILETLWNLVIVANSVLAMVELVIKLPVVAWNVKAILMVGNVTNAKKHTTVTLSSKIVQVKTQVFYKLKLKIISIT